MEGADRITPAELWEKTRALREAGKDKEADDLEVAYGVRIRIAPPKKEEPFTLRERVAMGEKLKLNLGAGEQRYKGYIGVDVRKTPACDIQHDLLEPLPFPDGCASHIFCSHALEHLPGHKAQAILRDWHRVLADGGILWGFVPDGEAACALWLEAVKNGDEWGQKRLTDIILGGYATDYLQGREQSHCMLYDAKLLRAYMTDAGFQIVDIKQEHPSKWDWRLAFYGLKGVYPEIEIMEPYFKERPPEEPQPSHGDGGTQ